MKTKTLLLFLAALSLKSLMAADVVLNDFETGSPTTTVGWTASYANADNPVSSGINTTSKCGKVGRTGTVFYEAIQFSFTSYTVPATVKRYIHIMVNCNVQAVVRIKVNKLNPYVTPINQYIGNGTWQDLVFEVTGATGGTSITSLYIMSDYGTGAAGSGVLDNATKFMYLDEIIVNDSYAPRGVVAALTTLSDFEAASFASPITSTRSYATGGTTWSIANPASDAVNSSAKCYQVIKASGDPTWTGLELGLGYFSTINTSNQYLHVMVYKTVTSQIGFQYTLGNGSQITAVWDNSQTSIINQWTDYVYQIPIGTIFKQLNVEILAATGTFYMDNIELNNNPLPRGGVTYMTDNNLCDFETDISTSTTIKDLYTFADATNTVTYPVANPFSTGANITNNVGKRTTPSTAVNWFTGFGFTLKNPILIDNNHKYLHVLVTVPTDGQNVNISLKQGANTSADIQKTITLANVWQDFVVDLSSYSFISDIFVKCGDWGGVNAAGDYYFDEIRIDNDPTPRSNTATALNSAVNNSKIYSSNGNIVIESNTIGANVTVFNSCGQKVATKEIGTNASISVKNKGIYFVNIGNETTKVIVK